MRWPLDHYDVFPEFLQADWYHVACTCFMPQSQFWNHEWPHGQRGAQYCCCLYQLYAGLPTQVSCNVCFSILHQAVRSGCPASWATAGGNQLTLNWYATNFHFSTSTGRPLGPWRADTLTSLPCGLHPSTGHSLEKWQQDPAFISWHPKVLGTCTPPVRPTEVCGWPGKAPTNWPQGPMPCWD